MNDDLATWLRNQIKVEKCLPLHLASTTKWIVLWTNILQLDIQLSILEIVCVTSKKNFRTDKKIVAQAFFLYSRSSFINIWIYCASNSASCWHCTWCLLRNINGRNNNNNNDFNLMFLTLGIFTTEGTWRTKIIINKIIIIIIVAQYLFARTNLLLWIPRLLAYGDNLLLFLLQFK